MIIQLNLIFSGLLLSGAVWMFWRTNQVRRELKVSDEEMSAEPTNGATLLSISVPKNNDRTPQAAEQLFASLHGLYRLDQDQQRELSLEIVARHNAISFFVWVPADQRDFVVSQIFAQYPNVEIKEVESSQDYAQQLPPDQVVAACELHLNKPSVYPIKTFVNFEVDPLSAITSALSTIGADEQVWTQIIIRPVDDNWQDAGAKVIKDIKEPPKKPKGWSEIIMGEAVNFGTDFVKNVVNPGFSADEKQDDKKGDKEDLPGPVKQAISGIEDKITRLGFETTIRVLAVASSEPFARAKLESAIGAYKQFNSINQNGFVAGPTVVEQAAVELFKRREFGELPMIFNTLELASLFHFPSDTVTTPMIAWAGSKKGEPPANLPIMGEVAADELTVFAQTNFRSQVKKFGLKRKDRRLHSYIIGKTGTGKSTLLENMIIDDINEGRGLAVVDPHGELIKHILDFIPESRIQDVVYFNPADSEHPVGLNLLENVNIEQKNIVASGVVGVMEKIFGEVSWGPRLEYILRNVILALLDYPNSTFLGIMRLLTDTSYRRQVINAVQDPVIRDFFQNEFEKYDPKFRTEAVAPIQNKVGQFLSSSVIRNIIGQPKSTIDIGDIMDTGKILLADLSIGKIGEDNSTLLGSMLITKIQLAAMRRANMAEDQRRDFYLYVDEFQNFATDSFATILSEARKYKLNLIMANQYIAQMPEKVSSAVFGNVGTMISFRVGATDAGFLEKEFEPVFNVNDLVNLDNYQIYLKMAIDGVTAQPFSAGTLPPRGDHQGLVDQVVASSRELYTRSRSDVEDYITEWSEPIDLSRADSPKAPLSDARGSAPMRAPMPDKPERVEERREVREEGSPPKFEQPVLSERPVEPRPEPVSSSVDVEPRLAEQENRPELAPLAPHKHQKIEIIKDRFDRNWYAVSDDHEQGSDVAKNNQQQGSQVKTEDRVSEPTPVMTETHNSHDGGEAEKSESLIEWHEAEKLGILPVTKRETGVIERDPQNDLLPLNEL